MASTRKPSGSPHGIFSFSDMFLEDLKVEEIRNLHAKSLPKISREDSVPGRGPRWTSSGRGPPTSSKTRANAALMKLAQIETKILSRRKVPMTLSDTESDSKTTDEGLLKRTDAVAAPLSSQHSHRTFQKQVCETPVAKSDGQNGKASRFLKKKKLPIEDRSLRAPDETEKNLQVPGQKEPAGKFEEMKRSLGSWMESSTDKDRCRNQELSSTQVSRCDHGKPFLDQTLTQPALCLLSADRSTQGTLQSIGHRTLFPPTHNAGDTASLTPSPSISDDFSKSAFSRMGCIQLASSLSRSKAGGPSKELVSEASDDSLHDFRVNILSIDDLAPAKWEKSNMEQKEESAGRERLSGRSSLPLSPAQPLSSTFQGTAASVEEDLATENDISEHMGASSASSVQTHRTPMTHMASMVYTEDFEQSSSPSAFEKSLDRTLDTLSQFSSSLKADLCPSRPPLARTKWGRGMTRVVKETAVQTLDPAFAYQWTKAGSMATMGPVLGGAYVDPVPVASHVVSADAIEALTAYSPAALALNDMLKQQLSLTQQFIEASRQLHVALLQSLDEDSFHYHTLEEAREYIRCHRPMPLTMEAALQEVKEELQVLPCE
uniref:RIKEN cDNA 1700030K09 gene n=1 Tax=Nannospalax galili TaxID=1026970 RepID=A0A8C6RXC2_NANGA